MLSNVSVQFHALLTSPAFLACVSSWLCAQFLKTVIRLFSGNVHTLSELFELMFWRTGGMPSSHSAVVACLCVCVGFRSGFDSDVFVVSFILFFITIRDALGVRRSTGIQAKRINEMIGVISSFFGKRRGRAVEEPPSLEDGAVRLEAVKEVNGHTPMEVFVGSLFGFFIGVAFSVFD